MNSKIIVKIKFKNKETKRTHHLKKGFSDRADAKSWIYQFENTEHIEVINKKIKEYSLKERLKIAREKVVK